MQFWGIILFTGKHQNLIDVFFGLVWPGVVGGLVRYTLKINYVLKSVNPINTLQICHLENSLHIKAITSRRDSNVTQFITQTFLKLPSTMHALLNSGIILHNLSI